MFGSVSQHFANLQHKNSRKSCISRLKALFRVPNFRKKFRHEHIECNLLDPKQCIGVFRSISQTFGTKTMQKFCFEAECTISGYRTSRKSFATNASNLTYSIQSDVWECFGAFRKPSTQKFMKKLCFEPECTILWYRTSGKSFATNASNLTY